jgi:hypothetical protein
VEANLTGFNSADLEDENVKKNYMDAYGVLLNFFHEHM